MNYTKLKGKSRAGSPVFRGNELVGIHASNEESNVLSYAIGVNVIIGAIIDFIKEQGPDYDSALIEVLDSRLSISELQNTPRQEKSPSTLPAKDFSNHAIFWDNPTSQLTLFDCETKSA